MVHVYRVVQLPRSLRLFCADEDAEADKNVDGEDE